MILRELEATFDCVCIAIITYGNLLKHRDNTLPIDIPEMEKI